LDLATHTSLSPNSLVFIFWSLCCLFFFDIRLLVIPLVSLNSSYRLTIVLTKVSRNKDIYSSLRSLLRFPYVHIYVRFTKLVLSLRVTTYDLRQITSPIMEVKRYYIVSYILYIINPTAQKLIRDRFGLFI
jgi:hypothetical protein